MNQNTVDQPAFPRVENGTETYWTEGLTKREYAAIHIAAGLEASLSGDDTMSHEAFARHVWARVRALFPREDEA